MFFHIPIILYHHVSPEITAPTSITPDQFEKQMEFLSSERYTVFSLSQAIDFLDQGRPAPPNSVILSFDDGYEDNYIYAYPILYKFSFSAIVFLTSSVIGLWNSWNCRADYKATMLSWRQISEMADSGIEFGAHGDSHHSLIKFSESEIRKDLAVSKDLIQQKLQKTVMAFAYPYGRFDNLASQIVKENFAFAATTSFGTFNWFLDRWKVNRLSTWSKHSLSDFSNMIDAPRDIIT